MIRDEPIDWAKILRLDRHADHNAQGRICCASKALLNVAGEADSRSPSMASSTCSIRLVLLPAWPGDDRRSKLVFITRDLDQRCHRQIPECVPGRRKLAPDPAESAANFPAKWRNCAMN